MTTSDGPGPAWRAQQVRTKQEMLTVLGERIRALRTAKRWTCERLAHETSLTIATVSKAERGRGDMLLSTVLLIIDGLDATPCALLAGITTPPKKRS
jgi:transcriptional regulator with XRE-family HTH domain